MKLVNIAVGGRELHRSYYPAAQVVASDCLVKMHQPMDDATLEDGGVAIMAFDRPQGEPVVVAQTRDSPPFTTRRGPLQFDAPRREMDDAEKEGVADAVGGSEKDVLMAGRLD